MTANCFGKWVKMLAKLLNIYIAFITKTGFSFKECPWYQIYARARTLAELWSWLPDRMPTNYLRFERKPSDVMQMSHWHSAQRSDASFSTAEWCVIQHCGVMRHSALHALFCLQASTLYFQSLHMDNLYTTVSIQVWIYLNPFSISTTCIGDC